MNPIGNPNTVRAKGILACIAGLGLCLFGLLVGRSEGFLTNFYFGLPIGIGIIIVDRIYRRPMTNTGIKWVSAVGFLVLPLVGIIAVALNKAGIAQMSADQIKDAGMVFVCGVLTPLTLFALGAITFSRPKSI